MQPGPQSKESCSTVYESLLRLYVHTRWGGGGTAHYFRSYLCTHPLRDPVAIGTAEYSPAKSQIELLQVDVERTRLHL
jgi:hypothetical protein